MRHNKYVPRFDTLEDRACPSSIRVWGPIMYISGDNNGNPVAITDNGNGTVTATIDVTNTRTANGIRAIVVDTKGGDDDLVYNLVDHRRTHMAVAIKMGSGVDSADFNLTGNINPGKIFGILFDAGSGNDGPITFDYTGELDGKFAVGLSGGSDNDNIAANFTLATGSTGRLGAAVTGLGGNDNLALIIANGGSARVDALLDGGTGTDLGVSSPGVRRTRLEA